MSGGRSVSFEVYYLQYGRWQIHHRYPLSERDAAIDEAKRLDTQGHFDAACVVRESFDKATGTSNESVIYHSPKLKTKPPVSSITAGADGSAGPTAGRNTTKAVLRNAPSGSAAANAAALAKQRVAGQKAENGKKATGKEPELRRPPKAKEVQGESDWSAAIPKLMIGFLLACLVGTGAGIGAFYVLKGLTMAGLSFGSKTGQILLVGAWLV